MFELVLVLTEYKSCIVLVVIKKYWSGNWIEIHNVTSEYTKSNIQNNPNQIQKSNILKHLLNKLRKQAYN